MKSKHLIPAFFAAWMGFLGPASAGEPHRVLILTNKDRDRQFVTAQVLVVDIDSGKISAQAETGYRPDVAVSPKGDVVAVVAAHAVAGRFQRHDRLELYRLPDLRKLESGPLPFTARLQHGVLPPHPLIQFSPDGGELIVQALESFVNDETPIRKTVDQLRLNCVKLELDENGAFKSCQQSVLVPRCRAVAFLRVEDWPRVHIWNEHLGVIQVVDLSTAKNLKRLPIGDDPQLNLFDSAELEKPNIGELYFRLNALRGTVFPADGRYGYYIPWQRGFIRKIDLAADPPSVLRQGQTRYEDLDATVAATSGKGHAIFVKVKGEDRGGSLAPSARLRVFNTFDLEPQGEIDLSIDNINKLEASLDGKYMYAVDWLHARLAVIDIGTGREIKVLDDVGHDPAMIIALP